MRSRQQSLFFRRFVDTSMSRLVPLLPAAAQMGVQCSGFEKIRKRMSLHKPVPIPTLRQFVSNMLGHPPIPNTKYSMLAMHLMSTCRQKKAIPQRRKSTEFWAPTCAQMNAALCSLEIEFREVHSQTFVCSGSGCPVGDGVGADQSNSDKVGSAVAAR